MQVAFMFLAFLVLGLDVHAAEFSSNRSLRGSGIDVVNLDAFIVHNGDKGYGDVSGVGAKSAPAKVAIYSSPEDGYDVVATQLASVAQASGVSQAKLYLRLDLCKHCSHTNLCTPGMTTAIDVWNNLLSRVKAFEAKRSGGHKVVGLSFETETQANCNGALLDRTLFLAMASEPETFPTGLESGERFGTLKVQGGYDSVAAVWRNSDLSSGYTPEAGSFTWDYLLAEYSYEPFDDNFNSIFGDQAAYPTVASCVGKPCYDRCSATPVSIAAASTADCPPYLATMGPDGKPRVSNVPCTVPGLNGAKELVDAGIKNPNVVAQHQIYTLGYGAVSKGNCRTTAVDAIGYAAKKIANSRLLNDLALLV